MVSAHVPDVSGNKQNALIRLGMERGAATQPLWQGVSLVVDEYSRSAYGEIIVPCRVARKLRNHAQGAVLETPDATRLGPWRVFC